MRDCVACGASLAGRRSDALFCSREHRRWWQYYMDQRPREWRRQWYRRHERTDEDREKDAARSRVYRAAHPDRCRDSRIRYASRPESKARKAETARLRDASDPKLMLAGELVRMSELPAELQPIVALIKETRKKLRIGRYDQ